MYTYGVVSAEQFGDVVVVMRGDTVVGIQLEVQDVAACRQHYAELFNAPLIEDETDIQPVLDQLGEYFAGQRQTFDIAVDLSSLTPFQQEVLQKTAQIPYGSQLTYGEVAQQIGRPKSSRAVGQALAANPIPIVVPCHRVVGSNGKLTGFGSLGGVETKARLLALEGVQ